jgi:hypothetical protein
VGWWKGGGGVTTGAGGSTGAAGGIAAVVGPGAVGAGAGVGRAGAGVGAGVGAGTGAGAGSGFAGGAVGSGVEAGGAGAGGAAAGAGAAAGRDGEGAGVMTATCCRASGRGARFGRSSGMRRGVGAPAIQRGTRITGTLSGCGGAANVAGSFGGIASPMINLGKAIAPAPPSTASATVSARANISLMELPPPAENTPTCLIGRGRGS